MRAKRFGKAKPITQLTDIIKLEYFQQVRFFIDLGIEMEKTDENGRTPIMLCPLMEPEVWGTGIARLLIEKGASLENCDKYGMTVLHLACIYTRVELARVFLNAIDFDLLEQDKWGNTALHYAVRSGNLNLVKVITQAQWKYKFAFDKKNRDGYTALDEAYRLKMRKIAETIEAAENQTQEDADNESLSQIPSLNIRLSRDCLNSRTLSDFGSISRRSFRTRPKTAFLMARRDSASSSSSASSLYGHDRTVVSYRNFVRRELEPNERDEKMILRCAPLSDFRNNPEYLFHLVVPGVLPVSEGMKSGRPRSAYDSKLSSSNGRDGPYFSWRVEFKRLYRHYEYQCTPSYRDGIKIAPADLSYLDAPLTPAPSEDPNEDEKGKRSKRSTSSITKQNTAETGRQRKQSQQQQQGHSQQQAQQQKQQEQSKRRTSTVQSGKQSSSSMDGSMGSSSESISSGTSTKKEAARMTNGTTSGGDSHGRQSRVAHYT
ncbi:kinase D-interacting substrate of 220 kDa-like [Argopecten irradians]|uniref:kinase D-interacting substrate of 220 kDa-like n=1 Tax=Argopecten irradians TaxID=31199 RepID=UPI003718C8EC